MLQQIYFNNFWAYYLQNWDQENSILQHLPLHGCAIILKPFCYCQTLVCLPFTYFAIFIVMKILFPKSLSYTFIISLELLCQNNMSIVMTLLILPNGFSERLNQLARIHCTSPLTEYYHFLFTHFAYLRHKKGYLTVGLICISQLKELSNKISPLRSVICF